MKLLALIIVTLLSSCSNKQMYDSMQLNGRQQCQTLPGNEYDKCMAEYEKSYEEYETERRNISPKK